MDFILNGKPQGELATSLLHNGMNVNVLRPFIAENGKAYFNDGKGGIMRANADDTVLRRDEWKQIDQMVLKITRDKLKFVNKLKSLGLVYGGFNGMAKTSLEYEREGDMSDAHISMDGVVTGDNDVLTYDIANLPLPIISKQFSISARKLNASRSTGAPLDTTQAEICARKVAEMIETISITGASSYSFGGGTLYGMTDFPSRIGKVMAVAWNASAITGAKIVADVLSMVAAANAKGFEGPFVLMVPSAYSAQLNDDYKSASDKSTLQRIKEVEGISDVMFTTRLAAPNVCLVQLTSDVVRVVNGLDVTTVQWTSGDKMTYFFKVMAIQVPQYRADKAGNCGVVHLKTA